MFYIIELFSNDLQELFDFVVNILSQHTTISNIKEKMEDGQLQRSIFD